MLKMKTNWHKVLQAGCLLYACTESVPDTKASQQKGPFPSRYLVASLPLVRSLLQSEVCINRPAVNCASMEKLSVLSIVLLYFKSTILYVYKTSGGQVCSSIKTYYV